MKIYKVTIYNCGKLCVYYISAKSIQDASKIAGDMVHILIANDGVKHCSAVEAGIKTVDDFIYTTSVEYLFTLTEVIAKQ